MKYRWEEKEGSIAFVTDARATEQTPHIIKGVRSNMIIFKTFTRGKGEIDLCYFLNNPVLCGGGGYSR